MINNSFKRKALFYSLIALFCFILSPLTYGSEKWQGVDESVIERFAKSFGIEPKEPLINTDQGDLLLFLFLLAGAVGGFIAGYFWRVLVEQVVQKDKKIQQKTVP